MDISLRLIGKDVSASKALRGVGKTASDTGKKLSGFGKLSAGVFGGIATAAVASKVVDFGKQTVEAFANAGGATLKLQRYTGGTAESMSRLVHVANMSGVSVDQLGKGLGFLSKNLAANSDAARSLGISFRNADGSIRPLDELLPQISEKFATMPNGPEKTAMVLKLFGKAGMDLLPMLNKGAAGMAELQAESDRLGTTLSGSDLTAVKENTIAKRRFGEAVRGLQIAIGRELYPALTMVTNFLSNNVVPVIRTVVQWMTDHKEVVSKVAMVVGTLVVGLYTFVKVMGAVQAVTNAATAAKALLLGVTETTTTAEGTQTAVRSRGIIVLLAQKAALIASAVAMGAVRLATMSWAAVQWALNAALNANPIGLIVIAIAALVAGIIWAYNNVDWFREGVQTAFGWIATAWGWIVDAAKAVWDWISGVWQKIGPYILAPIKLYVGYVVAVWKTIFAAVGWVINAIKVVWSKIGPYIVEPIKFGVNVIKTVIGWVVRIFQAAVKVNKAIWAKIAPFIVAPVRQAIAIVRAVISTVTGIVSRVVAIVKAVWRTLVGALSGPIRAVWNVVRAVFSNIVGSVRNSMSLMKSVVSNAVGAVKNWFGSIWDKVASVFSRIRQGIKDALNAVVSAWNRISFTVPRVPGTPFGGQTIRVPQVPYLANGGVATRETLGVFGEAGPEAIIPLDKYFGPGGPGGLGGSTHSTVVNITVNGATDPVATAREIRKVLKRQENTTGRVLFRAS